MSARSTAGFTLLEVLVAVAITALACVVMYSAGSDGLLAVDTASRTEEAIERAQSHLAALGPDVASLQGESQGDDGGGYSWHLRVMPVASWPASGPIAAHGVSPTLFDVEVAISWRTGRHDRSVALRTRRIAALPASSQ